MALDRAALCVAMLCLGGGGGLAAETVRITRTDVAVALMRCEVALGQAQLGAEELAQVNRAFDRATLAFFGGDRAGTLRQVDGLTLRLLGIAQDPTAAAALRLRARISPPGATPGTPLELRLEPLYALPAGGLAAGAVWLELVGQEGTRRIELAGGTLATGGALRLEPLPVGGRRLELVLEGGNRLPMGGCAIAPGDLDAARVALEDQLAALPEAADSELVRARECAAARLQLLRASPDEEDTASSLADPLALLAELKAEVQALEAGSDPYRGRAGDQWRAFRLGSQEVRYRVQAPRAALARGGRLPVLIAFHGYQGDENMFRFAYGGGRLPALAEEQGLLLVTPRTEPFMRGTAAFDRLLEELGDDYPLDRGRIWLLGHSMGAQAAALLARSRAERLAGVVLFAGGPMGGSAPTRSFVGSLDIAGGMVRRSEQVTVLEGWGHTLGVGPHLAQALAWLRELPPRRVYY